MWLSVDQAGLRILNVDQVGLHVRDTCLCLPNARIKDVCYHTRVGRFFCLFCFYEHKIVGNLSYHKNCSQKFPRKLIIPPPTATIHDTPNTLWASPEVLISIKCVYWWHFSTVPTRARIWPLAARPQGSVILSLTGALLQMVTLTWSSSMTWSQEFSLLR